MVIVIKNLMLFFKFKTVIFRNDKKINEGYGYTALTFSLKFESDLFLLAVDFR